MCLILSKYLPKKGRIIGLPALANKNIEHPVQFAFPMNNEMNF